MSYALIFAGQGRQHAAMMPWLDKEPVAAQLLAQTSALLDTPWRKVLQDDALSQQNRAAQILMTGSALAAWQVLRNLLPEPPLAVAGYSVGELAACACAGAFSNSEALRLAALRADLMNQSAGACQAGLLSVSGVPVEQVRALHPQLDVAIRIDIDHAIYGASRADLQQAQAALEQRGAVCQLLAIEVASHTPRMAVAAKQFAEALQAVPFGAPQCAVVSNADAGPKRHADSLKDALSAQICACVDWAACMDMLFESGPDCILEIGPGSALSALWNRRHPPIPARSVDEFQTPAGIARWVGGWPR